jgi:glycosyltransferase involved in cell wall biosynthesis
VTRILHISADYPDAVEPVKTRAIAALVEGTAELFDHRVYSLNRVGGWAAWRRPGSLDLVAEQRIVRSCRFAAPARGFRLARAMAGVADGIAADLRRRGEKIDLVHGHKLTIEGLAARRLAGLLGVPFMLTVQGNSDQKLLRARPDLVRSWRGCWRDAAQVISLAPWATRWVEGRLGERARGAVNLPCILASDALIAPVEAPALVRTAFNLGDWRNKNIATLAAAVAIARSAVPALRLEIAGDGRTDAQAAVDMILRRAGVADIATRVGPIAPERIQQWMNGAALFALPSRRESFGMVFVEALLAGCPILHPRGASIDGYFDGAQFAWPVRADDAPELSFRIVECIRAQSAIKASLARWQEDGGAAPFRRGAIFDRYAALVRETVR